MKHARRVIDDLVAFLNEGDANEAQEVWRILTALRGPDDAAFSRQVKSHTTARLRRAIGLKLGPGYTDGRYSSYSRQGAEVQGGTPRWLSSAGVDGAQHHWLRHYQWARKALVKLGYIEEYAE